MKGGNLIEKKQVKRELVEETKSYLLFPTEEVGTGTFLRGGNVKRLG